MKTLLKKLTSRQYHAGLFNALKESDGEVYDLINDEFERQRGTLQLIAAEGTASRAVLAALGSVIQNKTTEGFIGGRFHGGCQVVDRIESLACSRAKEAFGACYVNVQPHSGTTANLVVLSALLSPGDRILGQALDQGGHLSHGAPVSVTGKFFQTASYCVDPDSFLLDYDKIREKALGFRPRLIICGATAYCRAIDFARFRAIADEAGAFLLADISHTSALVMAGAHPSPVDHAHFTTTSTYKPGGPRGGLIVMGRDYEMPLRTAAMTGPLWRHVERSVFPGMQGTPYLNNIAAKAVFFREAMAPEYRQRQLRVIENARALADELQRRGYSVLTGGTDTHMVLVNVSTFRDGLTGHAAQRCLEQCGIVVNKNKLPYDSRPAGLASGIRFGTGIVTANGMGPGEMVDIAEMVDDVLRAIDVNGRKQFQVQGAVCERVSEKVSDLCSRFAWDN